MTVVHETPARRVVFGAGSVAALADELAALGWERPLVIAGRTHAAHAERLVATLGAGGSSIGVRVHVPAALAADARARARELAADCVVAIGGGSAVGLAKAVALTEHLPIAAVPTTYAGSELTTVWGITEDGRKTTGKSAAVAPRLVLYDPELTYGLPAEITGPSGMNALAHCVEALWGPNATPLTEIAAREGIALLAQGIPRSQRTPRDPEARATALTGAWLAGEAFAAGGALHHKLCHVIGGMLDLPHAELHAILLPYSAAFLLPAAPRAADQIARALGTDDAAAGLAALAREVGIPEGLVALGMTQDDATRVAAAALPDLPAQPRRPTPVELDDLLARAVRGGPVQP
ncbi:MAG TPA: iron-containing alcohol dehydrogenase [Gaiellales bacterium]